MLIGFDRQGCVTVFAALLLALITLFTNYSHVDLLGAASVDLQLTWTPKPEPMLMRASAPARLGKEKPHKVKRHSPEQIIRKLRTAEQLLSQGQAVSDVCRALEVSPATYHRWQQLYGGMKASEAKRL